MKFFKEDKAFCFTMAFLVFGFLGLAVMTHFVDPVRNGIKDELAGEIASGKISVEQAQQILDNYDQHKKDQRKFRNDLK